MHSIVEIFDNKVLIPALTAWFIAQVLKVPTFRFVEKEWNWRRFFGAGGMPSSHTAFVFSIMVMVGVTRGFNTAAFAIAFTLAAVVMYDATGVRRETGTQAVVINKILKDMLLEGKAISDEQLKELVGHTPLEVAGGVIVSLIVCILFLVI